MVGWLGIDSVDLPVTGAAYALVARFASYGPSLAQTPPPLGATLRNIALTAPYFHSGKAWDLRQAVAVMGASQLGITLTEAEVDKITAFLHALTGDQPRVVYPVLPPIVATTPRPQP